MSRFWDITRGFNEECRYVNDIDVLPALYIKYASKLGVTDVQAGVVWAADERSFLDTSFGTTPTEYGKIYRDSRFIVSDIVARTVMETRRACFWSEELKEQTLSLAQQEVIDAANQFGLRDGHTTCVELEQVTMVVSAIGDKLDLSKDANDALRMMSDYMAGRASFIARRDRVKPADSFDLTRSHVAVLTLKSRGDKNSQIAERLGASEKWVEGQLSAIRDILQARNTYEAVTIVAVAGLLYS